MAKNNGNVNIGITADDSEFEKSLKGLEGKAKSSFGSVGKTVGGIAKGVAAATAAIEAAGVAIAKVGSDFEASFAQVQTIMDPTEKSIEGMKDEILALSEATGVAATSLSGSVYNAISATGDTANSVKLVENATRLATAGFTDTESALSVITTAMNAYGLSAEEATRISDSLVQTQNLGVTTIAELSSSMGKAIASASAYGIDLKNVEAAYISMTKSGINTAESTTYMSSMFKELGDSGSAIAKVLQKETGKSFSDLMNEGASLADVLEAVYKAAGEDSTALMNMWGSAEAGKAANAIINQRLDNFRENLNKIEESAGSTEAAYETMIGTVQHQSQMLTNTIKNLGISIFESYSGDIAGLMAEVNGWASELSSAFAEGGIDGLGDAVASIAPKLLNTLVQVTTKAVDGLSKKFPSLVKNLMSTLPKIITSAGDITTSIIEGLGTAFGVAVQELIGNLPSILSSLVPAIGDVLFGLFSGIGDISKGISLGLEKAFRQGQVKLMSGDWVDESLVKTMDITLDTNYEETGTPAEDIVERITKVHDDLVEALDGIEGVDADQIANKIISGDVSAAIEAVMISSGVDSKKAQEVAQAIKQANDVIKGAVDDLGLDETQIAHLKELAAGDGTKEDIEAYLASCGVDPSVANQAAGKIINSRNTIDTAIKGLPEEIATTISGLSFEGDKAALTAALQKLNMDGSEIDEVLKSFESIQGSLSAGVAAIFDNITNTLTDGKADTPEEMGELEEQVRGWAKSAYEQIEIWYADELKNLNAEGLSGEAYETRLAELNTLKDGYIKSVEDAEAATVGLIGTTAGKVGADLQAALAEIDAAEQRVKDVSAQVDGLGHKISDASNGAYKAVKGGWTADEQTVSTAVSFVVDRFRTDTDSLKTAQAEAIKELNEKGLGKEEYQLEMSNIKLTYKSGDNGLDDVETLFKNQLSELVLGLADFAGVEFASIGDALTSQDQAKALQGVMQALSSSDFDHMSDEVKQKFADVFDVRPEDLNMDTFIATVAKINPVVANALRNAINPDTEQIMDVDSFNIALSEYVRELSGAGADAFNALETGPVGEAIRGWIKAGVFNGVEGIDTDGEVGVSFAEALAYLSQNLQAYIDGNPIEFEQPANITFVEGDEESNPAKELTDDETEKELPPQEYKQKRTVNTETEAGEIEGAEETAKELTEKTETALKDANTGETVRIAQNAKVDLNVTATVSGTDFTALGEAAGEQFAQGLAGSSATGEAAGLASSALSGLKSAEAAAQTLGSNFAKGYAQGIASGSNSVIAAAAALAAKALKTVKDVQASASPSKETRKLGEYFGEGYEIGIAESMARAVDTARMMAGEVLNASVIGSNGLGVIRVEAGNEPLQVAMEGADKPVYLDGVQIASIQGGNNTAQIEFLADRDARGVGK